MGDSVISNIFFMFGGVAVLLFGMKVMGSNLELFAGNKMKKMLGKITNNRLSGVGIGAAVTALIQSSAATTVMLVGFVNVGLMTLSQAASVIMGANIGTTITAQILSLSGAGGIDVSAIAAFVASIGLVLALFLKNEKVNFIGYILLGFGMIFIGLEILSASVDSIIWEDKDAKILKSQFETLFQGDHFPLVLVLIGTLFTALIQSSSTVTGILVALAGALKFETAVFIILGSNIGTCVTAMLSAVGTSTNAKRTAMIHLLFNLFGCIICIVPLWIWGEEFSRFMVLISGDLAERQIANFHTLFNLFTTLVLIFFVKPLVKITEKIIPDKQTPQDAKHRLTFIDDRFMEAPAIAVGNVKKEIVKMAAIAKENINLSMEMLFNAKDDRSKLLRDNEDAINFLTKSIASYLTALSGKGLSVQDEKKVGSYYHVISDIERVGDYAENIMEYAFRLRKEEMSLSEEAAEELKAVNGTINELFDVSIKAFDERERSYLGKVDELEEIIDKFSVDLEDKHLDRLKRGICSPQVGSVYLQTVSNLERVGDHITNVAFSITQYNK
ncbi:MAG: Na/Pi cotransporter family protein [Candidatus Borkfalkiaceae bacterium]|nr:Na/Pi cotransporter family protein [Christensenellaceae bacterium]